MSDQPKTTILPLYGNLTKLSDATPIQASIPSATLTSKKR